MLVSGRQGRVVSVREVTMYRVECDADGCSASPQNGSEYVAWSDTDGALSVLDPYEGDNWDWYRGVRGHYCPEHAPTCLRDGCTVRYYDDEFGVVCEDHADDNEAAS